jgi:hypothetical protein
LRCAQPWRRWSTRDWPPGSARSRVSRSSYWAGRCLRRQPRTLHETIGRAPRLCRVVEARAKGIGRPAPRDVRGWSLALAIMPVWSQAVASGADLSRLTIGSASTYFGAITAPRRPCPSRLTDRGVAFYAGGRGAAFARIGSVRSVRLCRPTLCHGEWTTCAVLPPALKRAR